MTELLETLKGIPVEVLFIVVLSTYINKYVLHASRVKFLVPLGLSLVCALLLRRNPESDMVRTWFEYAGQSMVLYEVYKHVLRKFIKKKGG